MSVSVSITSYILIFKVENWKIVVMVPEEVTCTPEVPSVMEAQSSSEAELARQSKDSLRRKTVKKEPVTFYNCLT